MATINSAFNLITSALEADQPALNIVANNVANANAVANPIRPATPKGAQLAGEQAS